MCVGDLLSFIGRAVGDFARCVCAFVERNCFLDIGIGKFPFIAFSFN